MSEKVVLYFVAGMVPTEAERAAAASLGTSRFRNARLAGQGPIEKCDAVAGLVPKAYREIKGVKVLDAKEPPKNAPDTQATPGKQPMGNPTPRAVSPTPATKA